MPDDSTPAVESRLVAKRRTRLSIVWIVPIVAALAGAWVAVTRILAEGPEIRIVFRSADGLEAGKTKIEYNGVEIGIVTTIRLSDDHKSVITTAKMAPETEGFLVEDTRFWVVRPRVSGANITGLGTLISGAYVTMEIGKSANKRRAFVALDTPPVVTRDVAGRFFNLTTTDLGSVDSGTPLFYRRLQVGEVASYELAKDGLSLNVRAFVKAPYDQYVTTDTRFWHASGIDVSLSAEGLSVQTQSALSVLIGGIAFENAPTGPVPAAADEDTTFTLFANRTEAFRPAARNPENFKLVFKQSVRGLAVGAPVEFRGIPLGEVVAIDAQIDAETMQISAPVTIVMDSQRLGVEIEHLEPGADFDTARRKLIDSLVAHGVRAQLQSGSLLTGAKFVALDFFPDTPPEVVDWSQRPVQLPTAPAELEVLEASVASIVKKVDSIPFKAIGDDLHRTILELDRTLETAGGTLDSGRGTLDSANLAIKPAAGVGPQLMSTLEEVSRAARSLRTLMDYLERHPEALLRGKTGEAK
jgi:paraquat-inducible protein B